MKNILLVITILFAASSFVQANDKAPSFHRLLVFNDENQLMVVKIKNTNFWVTPGLYNENNKLTHDNLYQLAADYGFKVTKPSLKGIFTLKNKKTKAESSRHFYNVKVSDGEQITPDNIEEIKWLPLTEAMQLITFPHINILLKQITQHPENIWGGTILRYKEGKEFYAKMLSDFYPLKTVDIDDISSTQAMVLDDSFLALVAKHKINTAGVAVIKNNKVVWQNQYGFQSPGVPANENTLFNVASLTKTITAETLLRLVATGKLSLDESIAPYWVDPDLQNNPEVHRLTPRMLLTHTSGFMNWRYFANDRKLSFINTPGEAFGYSGEGFEYLAKYAEKKLGMPFEQLVESTIFEPLAMKNSSMAVRKENFSRIAKPMDENGKFHGHYCHPSGYCSSEGSSSAAANLVMTVSDYAKFLISSIKGEGLSAKLKQDRNTMQGIQFTQEDIDCSQFLAVKCPTKMGYGLGWSMSDLKNNKIIGHRGTNWTVVSLAYYYQDSGDGLIIFFNAPNKAGLAGMVDALKLLDPDSPELPGYELRLARKN